MAKDILWGVTIFLFLREWMTDGGYSEQNEDYQKEKILCKVIAGGYFGKSCN